MAKVRKFGLLTSTFIILGSALWAQFAYVANLDSNTITAYRVETSGTLTRIGELATEANPMCVAIHPGGRFAYVASLNGAGVSAYVINQMTGALTLIGVTRSGHGPASIAFHPSGAFAYVANFAYNLVAGRLQSDRCRCRSGRTICLYG
jgi:6-phosphogluconolactonase (cycloisomerase 2 family)